ncbi:flagellar protein FlaE [Haladaptatus litoreus]|uniref:Flagellar protein FlaE n=1 Tax=Haladaptatus litoreus TaxID=553468 RepID=A0A1N6V5H3_9EURY|nr:FlaD/FlaE family flagellar protein [Haladaptatus litoreus]SIQ73048.1 flagellar protein FlaE [Haladaptatus litoreus]
MTIKPADYDLRELRRMADEDEPPLDLSADDGQTAEDIFRLSQREELMKLQTRFFASGSLPEKPYLTLLPSRYGAEVIVFEWLDFLIEKAGFENSSNALSYYEEIGWLSEPACEALRSYMYGFSEVDRFGSDGPADLDTNDHVLSLVYIARLATL